MLARLGAPDRKLGAPDQMISRREAALQQKGLPAAVEETAKKMRNMTFNLKPVTTHLVQDCSMTSTLQPATFQPATHPWPDSFEFWCDKRVTVTGPSTGSGQAAPAFSAASWWRSCASGARRTSVCPASGQ